jgi:hypothetical protein
VIAALYIPAINHPAHRQRQQPVRATVFQGSNLAGTRSVDDDIVAKNGGALEFSTKLAGPARDVPCIPDEFHVILLLA